MRSFLVAIISCFYKPLVLTVTGGGKSIKKDLTLKKAMIMAGKKAKVVTVDQLQQAVALIARVEAVSDLTIDQVYSNMSVEQLEELKNELTHGKTHLDYKLQQAYLYTVEGSLMQSAVDAFTRAMVYLQKICFEAFVKKYGDPESGNMKAADIVHAIDIKVAVKQAMSNAMAT